MLAQNKIDEAARLMVAASPETMRFRIRINGGASGVRSPASCSIRENSRRHMM